MRLVLEYIEWLTEKSVVGEVSDDITINIRKAQEKKHEKKALTLEVQHFFSFICIYVTKLRMFMHIK